MEEFTQEFVQMWKRWDDFKGRSNVREYWMAVFVNFLFVLILGALGRVLNIFNIIDYIYGIVVIVPSLALFVRRMHDINKSGWNILWIFVIFFGWVYLIYILIQPSK